MKLGLDFTVDINNAAVIQDLNKFYLTFAQAATKEAATRIEKFARQEMIGYYTEYSPEQYERTMQMYNHSFKKFNYRGKNAYEGGIFVNANFTDHEPKGITEQEIYESVWDYGLHGRFVNVFHHYGEYLTTVIKDPVYIQGEPNRFEKIENQVASAAFQNEMFQIGVNAAMKQKYSVLRFS